MEKIIEKYIQIFKGNNRAFGKFYITNKTKNEYNKLKGTGKTIKEAPTIDDYRLHLEGKEMMGIIPIIPVTNTCTWAALDIDIYDLDILKVTENINKLPLQMLPIKSKSGGLHIYCFFETEIPCYKIIFILKEMSKILNFEKYEIYPKQEKLSNDQNDHGNWLNLPYFGTTERRAVIITEDNEIEELGIEDFLNIIDTYIINEDTINNIYDSLNALYKQETDETSIEFGIPPCLTYVFKQGLKEGDGRNNILFNVGVFLKKKYKEKWREHIDYFNDKLKDKLSSIEINKICNSVDADKDYKYQCKTVLKPYCNYKLCNTSKYGNNNQTLELLGLQKYNSNPPHWFVNTNEGRISLDTEELLNTRKFASACLDQLNILPTTNKSKEWDETIRELISKMQPSDIIVPSDDIKIENVIGDKLLYYCKDRCSEDKSILFNSNNVVFLQDDYVYFDIREFYNYCLKHNIISKVDYENIHRFQELIMESYVKPVSKRLRVTYNKNNKYDKVMKAFQADILREIMIKEELED